MGNRRPFKAAIIEFNPCLNNLNDNIKHLLKEVTEAAEKGAKLIVTPEMATTGYHYENRRALKPYIDTIPGKTTAAFEKVAKHYQTHIVIGMAEVDVEDGLYYNSAVLIGPDGYIGKYRKIHQWATENSWASWGDMGVPVYETEIGNISMIICMDASYFESARIAAVNGADILCFPTNSTGGSLSMLQAWAEMNGLYVLGANRSNTEKGYHMIGASTVWSPNGEKLAETSYIEEEKTRNETTIIYAEIDPAEYDNRSKRRLQSRQPDLYGDLMLHIGPWDFTKYELIKEAEDVQGNEMSNCAALLQYTPVIGDKKANLSKIKSLLKDTAAETKPKKGLLSLVVCPELSLTGPVHSLELTAIQQLGETDHDETVNEMQKLACMYQTHLVFGMIESDSHALYNTVMLLTPAGDIAAKARKLHVTESDERWATPGKDIVVTSTKGVGRVGLMVGYDAAFPETAGVMAVNHADFIIVPSCWHGDYGKEMALHTKMMENKYPTNTMTTWDAMARFAQAKTLIANFTGTKLGCRGGSAIYTLDPIYGGETPIVASSDKEEVLVVAIAQTEKDCWFDQNKLLLSRRTHYYRPLVKKFEHVPMLDCN
ncbi:carbon-nitrogen hydrolase family protein [Peribacillus cavernae]|nr:carbon-nitrogen hydrolase family protein [Peribacillus cavernae]MDQ0217685.1 putative amidohydrolase [Peribacillus cavernae]